MIILYYHFYEFNEGAYARVNMRVISRIFLYRSSYARAHKGLKKV